MHTHFELTDRYSQVVRVLYRVLALNLAVAVIKIVLGYTTGAPTVFFNDGTGRQFVRVTFGDDRGSAYGFALGDVNGDTFPDIAMARSGAPNVLYLSGK